MGLGPEERERIAKDAASLKVSHPHTMSAVADDVFALLAALAEAETRHVLSVHVPWRGLPNTTGRAP